MLKYVIRLNRFKTWKEVDYLSNLYSSFALLADLYFRSLERMLFLGFWTRGAATGMGGLLSISSSSTLILLWGWCFKYPGRYPECARVASSTRPEIPLFFRNLWPPHSIIDKGERIGTRRAGCTGPSILGLIGATPAASFADDVTSLKRQKVFGNFKWLQWNLWSKSP